MSLLVVRIALAASWRGGAVERRRAAMVAVASAVVVVIVLGCASALRMSSRIDQRATERAFRPASPTEPAAFERAALFDETSAGDQIYVYWWRVLDPAARVPGVEARQPTSGWFVSPALAELLGRNPSLAMRYPNAGVIDERGVAHPGELLAYRFVGPDIELPERLTAASGDDWIGDGAEVVDPYPIAVAALALVGVPGLGLIAAALSPSTVATRTRLALLHAVGASTWTQRSVAIAHAALAAAPGAVLGATGWYVIAPRLRAVPLVGRAVFQGDLAVPPTAAALAATGVILLVVAVAFVRPQRMRTTRPARSTPPLPSLLRVLPLVSGASVMVAGVVVPGRPGAKLFLVGVIATTLGTVVALPYLLHRAGDRLAQLPGTVWLLIGRRLRTNAVASTRSLLAVGTLAALLPVVGAWVAVAREIDTPPRGHPGVVELRGRLLPAEVAQLREELAAASLDLVTARLPDGRESLTLVGDCAELQRLVQLSSCSPAGFGLAGENLGGLQSIPGVPTMPPSAEVVSTFFLSEDGDRIENELRAFVVNAPRPGMQVLTPGRSVFHESPLVDWILGAATLAGIVGAMALILHLAGQAARLAPTRLRLLALGCERRLVRRLAGTEAGLSVAAVGLSCTAVGTVSSWMFVQLDGTAAVPYVVIALVTAGVVVAAAVAGLAAGAAVSRAVETEPVPVVAG